MAVQILAATTSVRIIAVDLSDEALELAGRLGAQHTVKSDADAPAFIRELVGPPPGGAEAVFDFVGVDPTVKFAASVVSTGGRLMLVGLGGGTLPIKPGVADIGVPMETRVVVPFWGTRAELAEVIALARAGRLTAHVETFPLANAEEAYERLTAGALQGRAVIVPGARADRPGEPAQAKGAAARE
jgi:propanol-preferring alcohol dehydrogenase